MGARLVRRCQLVGFALDAVTGGWMEHDRRAGLVVLLLMVVVGHWRRESGGADHAGNGCWLQIVMRHNRQRVLLLVLMLLMENLLLVWRQRWRHGGGRLLMELLLMLQLLLDAEREQIAAHVAGRIRHEGRKGERSARRFGVERSFQLLGSFVAAEQRIHQKRSRHDATMG